ncbi:polysaccharide export protein [Prolixibacteraceae bacterium JC049]|nr:polysaccharide export protein [Prolixibacteraceae bacterium JC049]
MIFIIKRINPQIMRNLRNSLLVVVGIFMLLFSTSCSTSLKDLTYLNEIETGKSYLEAEVPAAYKIRTNDNLYIQVIGDDPNVTAFLNLSSIDKNYSTETAIELVSYVVSEEGVIDVPFIGKVKVEGLTLSEVKERLQERVDEHLTKTSVIVKMVNRSITVLGEVNKPGQFRMLRNRVNIFEALGYAGDLTDHGNRKTVKLIREVEGKRTVIALDLTDKNLITSPYYHLLPNDLIYIEPDRKVWGAKTLPFATLFTVISTLFSGVLLVHNLTK